MGLGVIGLGIATACARPTPSTPEAQAARRAAEVITAADLRQGIAVIADDSFRGRPTPSPELDKVAAYIAGEFQRIGLRPGGDNGTFFQRYPLRKTQVDSNGYLSLTGRGRSARWAFGQDVAASGQLPISDSIVTGRVVLLLGVPTDTANPFGTVDVRGAILVQTDMTVAQRRAGGGDRVAKAAAAGARGWIYLMNVPAGRMANVTPISSDARFTLATPPTAGAAPALPVLIARDSAALPVLQGGGVDLAVLRDTSARGVRSLEGVTATIGVRRRVVEQTTAPNVIGVLEGSDPQLKNEYVLFTGHMDHLGVGQSVNGDSIFNGADDDASGTIGVVELARAFASLNPRPRRTLVFMTVSGEERGMWGSGYYANNPEVPLAQTVADLNLDMIGRNFEDRPSWRDRVVVIGKEHSSLGAVADRVTREHPELRMQLSDDIWPSQNFYRRSDHFNFARKGVPILFFFNGVHPDYHRVTDSVDRVDADKAARIVRMVFYVGLEVANATARPQWNPASRAQIVEGGR